MLSSRSSKRSGFRYENSPSHRPIAFVQNWFEWLDDDVGTLHGAISIDESKEERGGRERARRFIEHGNNVVRLISLHSGSYFGIDQAVGRSDNRHVRCHALARRSILYFAPNDRRLYHLDVRGRIFLHSSLVAFRIVGDTIKIPR